MARKRRRACYSLVSSIKDIVGESFIEDDADDQQKGDRNAMSDSQQKQTKIDTKFERPTETDSKETHTHTDTHKQRYRHRRTHTHGTQTDTTRTDTNRTQRGRHIHAHAHTGTDTHAHKEEDTYTHTHTQAQTHTHAHRERHWTHKQTCRQTPGHAHTHMCNLQRDFTMRILSAAHFGQPNRPFYTPTLLLHTNPCTHGRFYTQTL